MTLEQLPLIMLRALVLTIFVEGIAAWLLGVRTSRGQTTVALANLLTNPLVVSAGAAVQFFISPRALLPATLLMEAAVLFTEGAIYKKHLDVDMNPFAVSFVCNLASYGIGEILNRFVF